MSFQQNKYFYIIISRTDEMNAWPIAEIETKMWYLNNPNAEKVVIPLRHDNV